MVAEVIEIVEVVKVVKVFKVVKVVDIAKDATVVDTDQKCSCFNKKTIVGKLLSR